MTVTDVQKDPTALTMTIASEWDAPIARVWQLWADPRKLERWWGPPDVPGNRGRARSAPGRQGQLLHDQSRGGAVPRMVEGRRASTSRTASSSKTASPTPTANRTTRCRPPVHGHVRRAAGRSDAHGHRDALPVARGDGADDRDGHGGRHVRRHGPDRRDPRRRLIAAIMSPSWPVRTCGGFGLARVGLGAFGAE